MIVTTNSQVLAQELRLLCKIAPEKPTLPVLANVLFDAGNALTLAATDLELGLVAPCPAQVDRPGRVTLPARKLLEIAEQLPDADVTLQVEGGQARLTCGSFRGRLQAISAEDFPTLAQPPGGGTPLEGLAGLIGRTRYAVADKGPRAVLGGALLSFSAGVMAMVATDGKRLALATVACPADLEGSEVVPAKTLDMLPGLDGPLVFTRGERHLFFQIGSRLFMSRTIDGAFPAWGRIVPHDNPHMARLGRAALAAGLRRVGVVAEKNCAVTLTFGVSGVLLASSSAEVGEADEQVAAGYSGPDGLRVCLNGRAVLDFLEAARGQYITAAMKDANTPLLLSDGDDFINVVVLMRL